MPDIGTYNANETRAMQGVRGAQVPETFRSEAFDTGGFLVRIDDLAEIKALLTGLHYGRAGPLQDEVRGIDGHVLDELSAAMAVLVDMQLSLFPENAVVMPVEALLSDFLIARKLSGLPRHASILDVGPGCGLLPLFLRNRADVASYSQIEVTQSLYILQSHVNRACYGPAAIDLAAAPPPVPALAGRWGGRETASRVREEARRIQEVAVRRDVRCIHFPWWRADAAFEATYDVAMLNENLCEMPAAAAAYYASNIHRSLAPDGFLLLIGIGETKSAAILQERLQILYGLGFRALLTNQSYRHGGPLAAPNLVLVTDSHPRYREACSDYLTLAFDTGDPMVRSMYGLDRPTGPGLPLPQLVAEIARRVEIRRLAGRAAFA